MKVIIGKHAHSQGEEQTVIMNKTLIFAEISSFSSVILLKMGLKLHNAVLTGSNPYFHYIH